MNPHEVIWTIYACGLPFSLCYSVLSMRLIKRRYSNNRTDSLDWFVIIFTTLISWSGLLGLMLFRLANDYRIIERKNPAA